MDKKVYSTGEFDGVVVIPPEPPKPVPTYSLAIGNVAEYTSKATSRAFVINEWSWDLNDGNGGYHDVTLDINQPATTYTKESINLIKIKADLATDDTWYLMKTTSDKVHLLDTYGIGTKSKSGSAGSYGIISINFKQQKVHLGTHELGWGWIYSSEPTVFDFTDDFIIAAENLSLDIDIPLIQTQGTYQVVPFTKDNIKALKDLV